jgi:hypothetical protein
MHDREPEMDISEFDRDEAVAEAMEELRGYTRGGVLRRAGAAAGALLAPSGLALGRAAGGSKRHDVEILNFALTLEYLEAAFYAQAVEHAGTFGPRTRYFAHTVARHEATHVAALRSVLGAKAVAEPAFDFQGATRSASAFLATAKVLEDLGVAAYAGQGPLIFQRSVLAPAAAILAVEARHAAWVRRLFGGPRARILPAPSAFEAPRSMEQILDLVRATRFIKTDGEST